MSLQGWAARLVRSAWVTSDPSGSLRSRRPSRDDTMSRRPSGSQPVPIGIAGTRAMTSLLPSRSAATTCCVPMSENHRRSSCQRGDSPNTRPVIRVRSSGIETSSARAPRVRALRRDVEAAELISTCRRRAVARLAAAGEVWLPRWPNVGWAAYVWQECPMPVRSDVSLGDSEVIRNHAGFIWSVADLLRGDYRQSEYGRVILPLVVLRRLDCVLEPTKDKVLRTFERFAPRVENVGPLLEQASGERFYNTSLLNLKKVDFRTQIERLDRANLLYLVLSRFCDLDLHPEAVTNLEMGYLYEELIRRFSELSNETAGEHFTPREVIRLMVNLLFIED